MSQTYPKIESLYTRDDDHFVTDEIRCREFGLIKYWLVTEKIDGTNIRVSLEPDLEFGETDTLSSFGWKVQFQGRTDKAQIPPRLQAYLEKTFTLSTMSMLWRGKNGCERCGGSGWSLAIGAALHGGNQSAWNRRCDCVEPYPITLYGEGYGGRIQKGGNYRPDESFRLFDVVVDDKYWLEWKNVCDIAEKLGIKTVPVRLLASGIPAIADAVQAGMASWTAKEDRDDQFLVVPAEGIVARTDPYLYDVKGRPLRFKLKTRDYKAERPEREA